MIPMVRLFETLYRTDGLKDFPEGEYYRPRIESAVVNGVIVFCVREEHAYFSNTEKRMVHEITTFEPEEGYVTEAEASQRYGQQLQYRAKTGFVHGFFFDPYAKDGVGYRKLA